MMIVYSEAPASPKQRFLNLVGELKKIKDTSSHMIVRSRIDDLIERICDEDNNLYISSVGSSCTDDSADNCQLVERRSREIRNGAQ